MRRDAHMREVATEGARTRVWLVAATKHAACILQPATELRLFGSARQAACTSIASLAVDEEVSVTSRRDSESVLMPSTVCKAATCRLAASHLDGRAPSVSRADERAHGVEAAAAATAPSITTAAITTNKRDGKRSRHAVTSM